MCFLSQELCAHNALRSIDDDGVRCNSSTAAAAAAAAAVAAAEATAAAVVVL